MMLQVVAHDVKNKLAELAMRLMDTDIEAAALALDSADKLSQALLLDQPEQLATQIDAASPADLAEELAAIYGQLFSSKSLSLDLTRAPTLWYYDVALMRLALSNAVDNALKHCLSRAVLRVFEENGYLIFEVANDGPGFSDELIARDWNQGLPAGQVRKSTGHSTGMGLLLAHKIVQVHRLNKDGTTRSGFMRLSNAAAGGAVVRLAVP